MTPEQRQNVAREAQSWLRTPYHHHARKKGVGVDCIHLLCAVFEACQLVPAIDPGQYAPDWHQHRNAELYIDGLLRYAHEVDAPQMGDVVLARYGRTFSHGGVMVSEVDVVHALKGAGVIQTRLTEHPLDSRALRFYSLGA